MSYKKLDRLEPEEARELMELGRQGTVDHLVAMCPACINDSCFKPDCEHWGAHIYDPDHCNTDCSNEESVGYCITEHFRVAVGLAYLEKVTEEYFDWESEEDMD